jgi:hypothetical protein
MIRLLSLLLLPATLFLGLLAGQPAAPSRDWRTLTELPYVDFTGLTAAQKKTALDILRTEGCTCGCSMKLAECRVNDPPCGTSRPMAAMVIASLRAGKSATEIRKVLIARATEAPPVLDPPVSIPIAGAPFKGPADARLVLVEFSDYQ